MPFCEGSIYFVIQMQIMDMIISNINNQILASYALFGLCDIQQYKEK